MGEKKLAEAYILGIPFGLFGAHHFYLGRKVFGIIYACTLGLFGLGYIYDLIRMRWLVAHTNRYGSERKMVTDCYLICFLGGLFGAHHFYLGNKKLGIFYLCTLGVFGVGWIVDLLRMRYLVQDYNSHTVEKSLGTAYILALSPFGPFGAYHYYFGNWKLGLIYTFTVGIFGIGWLVDLFRMKQLVRKAGAQTHSLGTAYIMAAPPFGLFGAHHYYLENYGLGITYTCTLGIFGIGWIVDLFRMRGLVKASNDPTSDHGMTKITAYVLCVSPLGLFGAHHFYLKRYLNGGFYVCTLGLFGIGWIFDMFRLPVLYERYAAEDKHKYVDEAYIFWFPFGLFGLHQFYMGNKKWGILYACTLGCLGIGWVIDGLRLPSLIKDFNKTVEDPDLVEFRICRPNCKACSVYKCRRCCAGLFSCCFQCEDFTLSRNSRKSGDKKNEEAENEELRAMREADSNSRLNDVNQTNGSTVATVQNSYTVNMEEPGAQTAYENCAHPGDPGYGIGYEQDGGELKSHIDADENNVYPPPYETEQHVYRTESSQDDGQQYADFQDYYTEQEYTDTSQSHPDANYDYNSQDHNSAENQANDSYYDDNTTQHLNNNENPSYKVDPSHVDIRM